MGADLPDNVPVPQPRPETSPDAKDVEDIKDVKAEKPPMADTPEKAQEELPPLPVQSEDPAELATCLIELKRIGVEFAVSPRIDDGGGCGIEHPVTVSSIGEKIALKPEGEMRCETALQLARWTRETVIPALSVAMPGEKLAALNQASTYICRKRNNAATGKISEHARGNAVDIASLGFASGKGFSIQPRMKDSTLEGAFQRAITAAACLRFTTVLDPGSDAAHEAHLHLDVIQRKNGYRFCW